MRSAADMEAVNIMEDIKKLAPVAVARLEELLSNQDTDPRLVATVAHDILDRAGFGAPKLITGQFTHAHLTKEDIEELKARAAQITATQIPLEEKDEEVIDV